MREKLAAALKDFSALFDAFEESGFRLYAVGGCVRDWCLGKTPKDIDFTTDATPAETSEILRSHGMKVIPLGEAFGTIATIIHKKNYEITSFRVKESYTRGSRHPIVKYGKDLSQDLERRDLTINAMAVDRHGNLEDPFDGFGDLSKKILRVPRSSYDHSVSIFSDDPLRILRLARFHARLNFDVAPEATQAATDVAGTVLTVSHERWFAELDGLLRAPWCLSGVRWLAQIGLLAMLLPEIAILNDTKKQIVSLSNDVQPAQENLLQQTMTLVSAAAKNNLPTWPAFLKFTGFAHTSHPDWGTTISASVADALMLKLKVSNNIKDQTVRFTTPLPKGLPTYRSAREIAQILGSDLADWLKLLKLQLDTLPKEFQKAEEDRLTVWESALSTYLENPKSAAFTWPSDLSKSLASNLGLQGKTLGLCIKACAEAILDQELSDNASTDEIVNWAKQNFQDA